MAEPDDWEIVNKRDAQKPKSVVRKAYVYLYKKAGWFLLSKLIERLCMHYIMPNAMVYAVILVRILWQKTI
jgi:hypothetical protein